MNNKPQFRPLDYKRRSEKEILERSADFANSLASRRSIRHFSDRPVTREIIQNLIRAAGTAPSGANRQPWEFVAVADPAIKGKIRGAAEKEEREFYAKSAPESWLSALAPLGTGPDKPFLEVAPWLVAVFSLIHGEDSGREKIKHYYVEKSVGISVGFLLAAVHQAGLCALVYTPPRLSFLNRILNRPAGHRPFAIIPVGYPAENCLVPDIERKPPEKITRFEE